MPNDNNVAAVPEVSLELPEAPLTGVDKISKYILDIGTINFNKTQSKDSIAEYKADAQAKRDRKNAKRLKHKL
jgi:hypothetical protein